MQLRPKWHRPPILFNLLFIAMLLGGCFGLSGPRGIPKGFVDVAGVVRSLESGTPISSASVRIGDREAITEPDGTYSLDSVPIVDGRVWFHASAPGHVDRTGSVPSTGGSALRLDIDLPFAAIPGAGKVTGRINFSVPEFAWSHDGCPPQDVLRIPQRPSTFQAHISQQQANSIASGEIVVELSVPPTMEIAQRLAASVGAKSFRISEVIGRIVLDAPDYNDIDGFLMRVKQERDVIDAYPNELSVIPSAISSDFAVSPNDPCYGILHHLHQINGPLAWNVTTGDRSVVVAVVDSGVMADHPDLAPNLISGWSFVDRECLGAQVSEIVVSTHNVMTDCTGHGTHVSGIIGAVGNNGVGTTGVAWEVSILPVRVTWLLNATTEALAGAIYYATDSRADIINISLIVTEDRPPIAEAIADAVAQGVIVVASVGNAGPGFGTTGYLTRYDGVIGVGSVKYDAPTRISDFSSRGRDVDVVAPGEEIWSLDQKGGYVTSTGTSMSAPTVSGVVALMLANGIHPSDVQDILQRTAVRIGNPETNVNDLETYGYGLVNAYGAVLGVDPADAVLFVVNSDGRIVGSIASPDWERRYEIEHVPEEDSLFLVGWIDVNGSGTLDTGDYFRVKEFAISGELDVSVDVDLDVYDREQEVDLNSKWTVDLPTLLGQ